MESNGLVWLTHIVQLDVGAVFLVSGVSKVTSPRAFAHTVREYRIAPRSITDVAAVSLIAAELLIGMAVSTGWMLMLGLGGAGLCLLAFAVGVTVNLRRGRIISCGCFGARGERIGWRILARIGLLAVGVVFVAASSLLAGVPPLRVGEIRSAELVATLGLAWGVAMVAGWLLYFPQLIAVLRGAKPTH
ncbi:MauE/DoxX family redox-associated membrane protein [Streptomyces sp. CT34]|uniref:MauE/DoxX family redox-associated membrane protein n=1 Tax=Streptomyces sp. CT34 TaxID=1553907 RepID=UPI00099B2D8B|nr:MauE/DoxX family redox-associated membrane protein [Streptomyces sp. CT34]